jgi:hypothetical protein
MSRRSTGVKKRGMVMRYGDDHDCGIWVRCDVELEEEMERVENEALRIAECVGGYRECDNVVVE